MPGALEKLSPIIIFGAEFFVFGGGVVIRAAYFPVFDVKSS
jgi:hypothetical protein